MSYLKSGTPWELYEEDGVEIHVKRDDLCCDLPGPPYSKVRGVELFLEKQEAGVPIGVQDAGNHSRSGWGTAFICDRMGFPCHVFYAVKKAEGTVENHVVREYQQRAEDLGAILHPQKAGMATILYNVARKKMREEIEGIMLPQGLRLIESAMGTSHEARDYTPDELLCGTWIIAVSTATVASGVMMGLEEYQEDITFLCYFGSSKNVERTRTYVEGIIGYEPDDLVFVDEGWKYSDACDYPMPFPASKWYEAKAWEWLTTHAHNLEEPIVFWNIGT